MANPTILDFNFGVPRVRVPKEEPAVTDHPAFTIYHVARALHHFENSKGPKTTVPGILRDHPDLRVVRAIRPLQRVSQGELTTVKFRDPEKTNQQAAILLYALRPTVEDKKCGPCSSSQGNGPFELCIKSDPKDNNGTCLNCRYTGAMARCDHYKANKVALQKELHQSGGLSVLFPALVEREAPPEDLMDWAKQIDDERRRRAEKRALKP